MSPDQIIYVGKLLTILRGSNKDGAEAIKYSIDAFYRAASIKKKSDDAAEELKKDEAVND
jgi:P pilus assembly chaperone PapD